MLEVCKITYRSILQKTIETGGFPLSKNLRVAILDDHQSIIDGYTYRLSAAADVEIVGSAMYGEDLEPLLQQLAVDVLLLDVQTPTSPENANLYPILHTIPSLLERYPGLNILVISMHAQRTLIRSVMEAGASGYLLKDDQAAIRDLAAVVRLVASGGMYLSAVANELLRKGYTKELGEILAPRQAEALSLCAAYPDATLAELAKKMKVAHSTVRNLLSGVYLRLGVNTRAAAIAKARQMGLLPKEIDFS
jgi:DNA-binding NarL/FixJ family response regulator